MGKKKIDIIWESNYTQKLNCSTIDIYVDQLAKSEY